MQLSVEQVIIRSMTQGNPGKDIVLRAILEGVHREYTEDNYVTRIAAIVSWLLENDPTFMDNKNDTEFINRLKLALNLAVEDAIRGF